MNNHESDTVKPLHYRIFSHITRTRILHVGDALSIPEKPKLHVHVFEFQKGAGARAAAEAYVDLHDARLLLHDLLRGRLYANSRDGQRFEAIGGGYRDGDAISRVLTVELAETNNPVKIVVKNGTGYPKQGGLITPAWWVDDGVDPTGEVAILLDWHTTRKMALATLQHVQAWEIATYWTRIQAGAWQPDRARQVDPSTGEIYDDEAPAGRGELTLVESEPPGEEVADPQNPSEYWPRVYELLNGGATSDEAREIGRKALEQAGGHYGEALRRIRTEMEPA